MSCNHLWDCSRCGGQAERLTEAIEKAIRVIERYDISNGAIQELRKVVADDGIDLSE